MSGVNPTDWQTRSGVAHRKLFSEITPHLDGAGVAPRSAFPHSPHTAHSPSPRTDHAAFTPAYSTARWCSRAGAVGHAVIQLARWAGATVIGTVSGPQKAKLAKAAGAHQVINYREGDPAAAIRAIAPDGVDIVAEVALGANSTWIWPCCVPAARSRRTPTRADRRSN